MSTSLVSIMQEEFGLSKALLLRLIARAPHAYKVYEIPKKSGGTRLIAQPAKEIKYIQHWLIDNIFNKLPVHECASAYKTGASIKSNASRHKKNKYIAKFDFENFFPSIKLSDLVLHFTKNIGTDFSSDDIENMARLSCIRGGNNKGLCLSIGAPSSPILSNSVMYDFDSAINEWCKSMDVAYTRYADDLTFSTNTAGISSDIETVIKNIIRDINYPALTINAKKTIHLSKKHQRRITGVIINNSGELSLGRDRKRMISALIHRFLSQLLVEDEIFHLQGLLGFSKDIEPDFVFRMRNKYGSQVIDAILQVRKQAE